MDADLFAGVAVADLGRAVEWYDRFFGPVPGFSPNEVERVWTVAEHRHVYVRVAPEHAGHASVTLFVADLDGFAAAVSARGLEPADREAYGNGVRKLVYRDPDGNEVAVGGE